MLPLTSIAVTSWSAARSPIRSARWLRFVVFEHAEGRAREVAHESIAGFTTRQPHRVTTRGM